MNREEILAMDISALTEKMKQQYEVRTEKGFIGIYSGSTNYFGDRLVLAELFGEKLPEAMRKAALMAKLEEERLGIQDCLQGEQRYWLN